MPSRIASPSIRDGIFLLHINFHPVSIDVFLNLTPIDWFVVFSSSTLMERSFVFDVLGWKYIVAVNWSFFLFHGNKFKFIGHRTILV